MRERTVRRASDAPAPQRAVGDWRRVADVLHTDIIFGRLFPRERLVEDELMARFETSRHAARAAIDELVRSGLVVREANRGASVRAYTAKEVDELFEVQETLEAQAVRRMPLPAAPEVIARLKALQQEHEAAGKRGEPLAVCRANREFHDVLYAACGNERLADAIRAYGLLTDPVRMRRIPDPAWRKQAVAHHRQMIKLLAAGDREALAVLCNEHIDTSRRHFLGAQAALPSNGR